MVFFTCNQCGDSLKKNKVDQHLRICTTSTMTCMDCFKDFTLNNYSFHKECINEDQKYGGPNSKQQQYKGKNKQNEWIKRIKILTEKNTYPKEIKFVLNSLVNYDNIPRKKQKFINFIRNSFRIKDENLIGKVWSIFEDSIKNQKNDRSEQSAKPNYSSKKDLLSSNSDNVENTKVKIKSVNVECSRIKTPNTEKIKMKRIIFDILTKHGEISIKKLRKKVLKNYHKKGHNEDSIILIKFEKIISKKFINNNGIITLANS